MFGVVVMCCFLGGGWRGVVWWWRCIKKACKAAMPVNSYTPTCCCSLAPLPFPSLLTPFTTQTVA